MSTAAPLSQESYTQNIVTKDVIASYLKSFGLIDQLTNQEASQFVSIAEAYQLNPFKREIHCVPFGEGEYRKLSIIVGYEVYLKRAERTGKLDGWKAWVEGKEDNYKAVVEIHRKDWDYPFLHEVYWKEAVQTKRDGGIAYFWRKMPKFQLRKVAISQAFRMCFPDELGGIPYDDSEFPLEKSDFNPEIMKPQVESTLKLVYSTLNEREEYINGHHHNHVSSVDEGKNTLDVKLGELQKLLDHNCFTDKHRNWILGQVEKNKTELKVTHMINYAVKEIKKAGNEDLNNETF